VSVREILKVPNLISLLRIALIPAILYLVFIPNRAHQVGALALFIVAAVTDFLDGWMARRLKQESDVGRFLDPLADKVLVISALIAFLFLDPLIPFWMILIIVGRDVLITLMRYLAVQKGTELRTSRFGKVKTAFQMISIIIIMMVFTFRRSKVHLYETEDVFKFNKVYEIYMSSAPDKWLVIAPYCIMLLVTLLTALSGLRYIMTNWRLFLPPYSKGAARAR
jgi:cardiolipin synthase